MRTYCHNYMHTYIHTSHHNIHTYYRERERGHISKSLAKETMHCVSSLPPNATDFRQGHRTGESRNRQRNRQTEMCTQTAMHAHGYAMYEGRRGHTERPTGTLWGSQPTHQRINPLHNASRQEKKVDHSSEDTARNTHTHTQTWNMALFCVCVGVCEKVARRAGKPSSPSLPSRTPFPVVVAKLGTSLVQVQCPCAHLFAFAAACRRRKLGIPRL